MTARKELARRLLLEKAILDHLQAQNEKSRAAIAAEFDPGDADTVRTGDELIGKVSMAKGAVRARLKDRDAFVEWMRANRPDEVVETTTYSVRPATEKALLDRAKSDGEAVDQETGEEIPGIEVYTSAPTLRVALEDAGRELGRSLLTDTLGELEE